MNKIKAIEVLKNVEQEDLLDCWDQGELEYDAIQVILKSLEDQQQEVEQVTNENN
jgi:hypothetical protein